MSTQNLVTFDLEGTCVDFEEFHFTAFEQALAILCIPLTGADIAKIPGAVGGGDVYIATKIAEQFEVSADEIVRLKKRIFREMTDGLPVQPRAGLLELMETLRVRDIPIALGSKFSRGPGEILLRKAGLLPLFRKELILFGEDVTEVKPAPEVYLRTAELAGVNPSRQSVFEDSPTGIKAAKAAGSCAVAMPVPLLQIEPHLGNLMRAGADCLFLSWGEVDLDTILAK